MTRSHTVRGSFLALPHRDADGGSIAPAVAIIALFLFVLAGLIVDSSRLLNARSRAVAFAEEAARAGGQQIDLNRDDVRLDPQAAAEAVDEYCAAAAAVEPRLVQCRSTAVSATDVRVRTRFEIPTGVLGIVGVHSLTATGTGDASSQQGISGVDIYPSVPPPSRVVTRVPLPIPSGTANPSPTVTPLPLCTPPLPVVTPIPPLPIPPSPIPPPAPAPTPTCVPVPTVPAAPVPAPR